MKDPNTLEENIIYRIGELSRLFHKKITAEFVARNFGVTVEQFGILATLWYREGITQKEIADNLNRDKTTVARVVQNMIKQNLLVKIPDQIDNRNKRIYLTQKGKSLQKEMVEAAGSVYYRALQNIPDEEIKSFLGLMDKITKNLE